MKKISWIIMLVCFTASGAISQEDNTLLHQKDSALPLINTAEIKNLRELNLSAKQKKQIQQYNKAIEAKKAVVKKKASLTKQQKKEKLLKLEKEKHAKLEALLTPEQKEKLKHAKKVKPRRGVTNMPNERMTK